jgi:hypothetical protein
LSDQTPVGHSPAEVRREIWESLVSMVRVYAHAASLGTKTYAVTTGSSVIWVKCESCVLEIGCSFDSGEGRWNLSQPRTEEQAGRIVIEADGRLVLPDGPKELDEAAIDWIRQIVEAANVSNQQLRQPLGIA